MPSSTGIAGFQAPTCLLQTNHIPFGVLLQPLHELVVCIRAQSTHIMGHNFKSRAVIGLQMLLVLLRWCAGALDVEHPMFCIQLLRRHPFATIPRPSLNRCTISSPSLGSFLHPTETGTEA